MKKNNDLNRWEGRYQSGATGWDRGESSHNLAYWTDKKILKPCRILIPGCGNGYEVIALAKQGFDVVAIDIAPTAIDNLQKALDDENTTAGLILADFFEWQPEQPFDAIYEQTSLCALPPTEWGMYESQLHKWLKPQGKIYAQFMQTGQEGGPPFHCPLNAMSDLFPKNRWHWSEEHISQKMEAGKTELLYILEKIG